MTVKELREALDRLDRAHDDREIKAWLPGSTIRLSGQPFATPRNGKLVVLIEGNLDPGSALS